MIQRERVPTPVFWPREFHGLYSPWGHKESGKTEQLSHSLLEQVCVFGLWQVNIKWNKVKFMEVSSHTDTRKLIIFHMTSQYCLLKLRNAVEINLIY